MSKQAVSYLYISNNLRQNQEFQSAVSAVPQSSYFEQHTGMMSRVSVLFVYYHLIYRTPTDGHRTISGVPLSLHYNNLLFKYIQGDKSADYFTLIPGYYFMAEEVHMQKTNTYMYHIIINITIMQLQTKENHHILFFFK